MTTNNDEFYPKKLRSKACVEFLIRWHVYVLNSVQNNENISVLQTRSLLISRGYLNESFRGRDGDSIFNVNISPIDYRVYSDCSKTRIIFNVGNYRPIISIMRLSKPKSIRFSLSMYGSITLTDVSSFIRFCKTIKGLLFYYFSITTYF
jgi:hypothetical protein